MVDHAQAETPALRLRQRRTGVMVNPSEVGGTATPLVPRTLCSALSIYGDTPEKLRGLEQGWRARRRMALGELSPNEGQRSTSEPTPIRKRGAVANHETRLSPPADDLRLRLKRPSGAGTAHRVHPRSGRDPKALPPPTPPSTAPPLGAMVISQTSRPGLNAPKPTSYGAASTLQPILSSPLPSTTAPVPLLRARSETIMIHHPGSTIEITIRLGKAAMIQIRERGTVMIVQRREGTGWRTTRTLKVGTIDKLAKEDVLQWKTVAELVERFKRQTPRIRIWTDFGQLTITCSTPSDIILHYTTTEADTTPVSPAYTSKVRVTMSMLAKELRIDIASRSTSSSKAKDSFKSRRVAALSTQTLSEPGDPAITERQGEVSGHEAAGGFGVADTSGWSELEVEAVRRLWALRSEWKRWM